MPSMLSTVTVDYYGAPSPLQSLATVSTPDAGTLMIKPFDKTSIKAIEDGITEAGLGFNPSNDGEVIRINVPQLTEERRKELAKVPLTPPPTPSPRDEAQPRRRGRNSST